MDFLCRATNSPKAFEKYKENLEKKYGSKIIAIKDKNKEHGWHSLARKITFENGQTYYGEGHEDDYRRGYHMNVFERPSCYECKFKGFPRISDITLGDFWGIEILSDLSEDVRRKGISIVHAQTEIGKRYLEKLEDGVLDRFTELDQIAKFNGGYLPLSAKMQKRQIAFARWRSRIGLPVLVALSSFLEKRGRHFP